MDRIAISSHIGPRKNIPPKQHNSNHRTTGLQDYRTIGLFGIQKMVQLRAGDYHR